MTHPLREIIHLTKAEATVLLEAVAAHKISIMRARVTAAQQPDLMDALSEDNEMLTRVGDKVTAVVEYYAQEKQEVSGVPN